MANEYKRIKEESYSHWSSKYITDVQIYAVTMDTAGDPGGALDYMNQQFPIGANHPDEPFKTVGVPVESVRPLRQLTPHSYRVAVTWTRRAGGGSFNSRRLVRSGSYPDPDFLGYLVVKFAQPPPSGGSVDPPPRPTPSVEYVPHTRMIRFRYYTHELTVNDLPSIEASLRNFAGMMFWFGNGQMDRTGWFLLDDASTYSTTTNNLFVTWKFLTKDPVPEQVPSGNGLAIPGLQNLDEYGSISYSLGGTPSLPVFKAEDNYGGLPLSPNNFLPGVWE